MLNLKVILLLVELLVKVKEKSAENKMGAPNLAIVFSPSLLRPPPVTNITELSEASGMGASAGSIDYSALLALEGMKKLTKK